MASDADIMRDYDGMNAESTLSVRRAELTQLHACSSITIGVAQWPESLVVSEPNLTDGDRGFMWSLDRDSMERIVFPAMAAREQAVLQHVFRLSPEAKREVVAWLTAAGFASVEIAF